MLIMEAVRVGGGGKVEGLGGSGQGERNERQRDDHKCDIVLVLVMLISYIAYLIFLLPLEW